jgi:hypothetical protein
LYFVNLHLFTECAYTQLKSSCTRWAFLVLLVQEETMPFPYARILKIFYNHSSVRLSHLYTRMVQFPYRLESEDWIAQIFIPPILNEMPVLVYCATSLKCILNEMPVLAYCVTSLKCEYFYISKYIWSIG